MIIKSTVRGNGGKLASYLLNDKKNDRAELVEMRGWTAETLKNALVMSEEIALGKTQCEKPFYHVSFRSPSGEDLTPEKWRHCADKLEKRLGLKDHHRAMVMHTYKGEKHLHVVWDRIDENTLKAAELKYEHLRCKDVARELEKELGLQRVRNQRRDPEKELAAPTLAEEQQARRKGQDLNQIREAIREVWQQSRDGQSFAAALAERGFILAQGDRRDYVALDAQGGVYSIGKRTTGATAREVRAKLADLDREHIPTVEQARAGLAEREQDREKEPTQAQEREATERTTEPEPERERPRHGGDEHSAIHERGGLRVRDTETGMVDGVADFAGKALEGMARTAEGVIEGLASLFDGGSAPSRTTTQEPRHAPQSALQRLQERAARERALKNLSRNVQRGEDLNAADLRALPRRELERLRDGGDESLRNLVRRWEREQRERDGGRERER